VIKLFKYRKNLSKKPFSQLGILTLEEIFYSEFKAKGFEKTKIIKYDRSEDGFIESTITLRNQDGNEIEVIYPELDYVEDESDNSIYPEADFNWIDFLRSIRKGDVLKYEGVYSKE
jgi:hypothetical protein